MYVNLSLDKVAYKEKPHKSQMGIISNRLAKSPVHGIGLSQVADLVGNKGHTFSGAVFSDGKRDGDHFRSIQLLGLDFDDGISYKEIEQMTDYYNLPICFAYHTFSSSPENERFRVVFLHDVEITNSAVAEIIIDMLKEIFPACDRNCSDVVRFFFGGNKGLLKYQEIPIKLTDVVNAFCRSMREKENPHNKRDMGIFAKKHNVAFDGKCLKISEYPQNGNFLPTTDNIYTELGKFLPNSDEGNIGKHPRYLIEGYQEKNDELSSHPSENLSQRGQSRKGRFAGIKYAGRYCRLYREFDEGVDIGHDGRFHIMLSLRQIRDGKKLFLDIIYRTGNDYKKWKSTIGLPCYDNYEHERSCSECPYCSECDHDGTMLETVRKRIERDNVKKEVHKLHTNENYINLEEGRKRLHNNIEQAIESPYLLTLIKAQAGIGKTHAYKRIIKEQYLSRKFLVALPNNMLKMYVGIDLIKRGIPRDSMVITPSISEKRFPAELRRQVESMYELETYDQTERLIHDYIKANGGNISREDKEYLEYFLVFKKKMQDEGTRVVVTTHAQLSLLADDLLKDYTVIVDEDILVSSFFMQTRSVSSNTVRAWLNSGLCPENIENFLIQILGAEDKKVYTVNPIRTRFYFSFDMIQKSGLHGSINGLFRAVSYMKEGDIIHYYYPGKLPKTKCIILSATLDVEIYKKYFRLSDGDISYIEGQPIKYRGKVIQYVTHPVGRSFLSEEHLAEIESLVWDILGDDKKEDTRFITFKKSQYWARKYPDYAHDLYFYKCLGSNALEGKNVVVVGTPFVIDRSYKLIGAYLGPIDDSENPRVRRITYRGFGFTHMTYADPLLQNLQCYWLTGELEQAVGRARLLTQDKTVIVFSSVPCEQAEYICEKYLTKK